jgi:hypothetical protein
MALVGLSLLIVVTALFAITLLASGIPLILLGGWWAVRSREQKARDLGRRRYLIEAPIKLESGDLLGFITAVSGTLSTGVERMYSVQTIVYEVTATSKGIVHHIYVPAEQEAAEYVISELRTHIPGLKAVPDPAPKNDTWKYVIELAQRNKHRTLRIPDPARFATTVLGSVAAIGHKESVRLQIVTTPAVPEDAPLAGGEAVTHEDGWRNLWYGRQANRDEIQDRRAKIAEPNFQVVIRIGAKAGSEPRAREIVRRTYRALASARKSKTRFRRRWCFPQAMLSRRMTLAKTPLLFPGQLMASELAAIIAWPIDGPPIPGLPQGHARHLPANDSISREHPIGMSNVYGHERPLGVSMANRRRHLYIVGRTGVGKSTLLTNLIVQDMNEGRGVIVIDPKSDADNLFNNVLNTIPPKRVKETIVIDVNDVMWPLGINILQGKPSVVTSDMQRFFEHMYPDDVRRVIIREAMYHVLMTLTTSENADPDNPLTIVDTPALCVPRRDEVGFAEQIIRGVNRDPHLSQFWQDHDRFNSSPALVDRYFEPLMARFWQLISRPEIRNMVGQSRSGFDLSDAIKTKKIILINVSGQGDNSANLLGSLLVNMIWGAVKSGAADPKNPTSLYLDEFQTLLNLSISPAEMLAQSRSMGLSLVLAHQHLSQLERLPEMRDGAMNNTSSKVALGPMAADDARTFAREFGSMVDETDFKYQGMHDFVALLATDKGISWPVTGTTFPPPKPTYSAKAAREHTRKTYAKPVAEVEAAIKARHTIHLPEPQRAPIGKESWMVNVGED